MRELMDEIVAFAELEEFIDLPVRTYSSGMYMRLGFSVAAHIEADVLLLDEVFAVGDEQFQRKCFGKIVEFKNRGGTIVFVSHDAQAVERLCDRAVLLRQGEVAFDGSTREAIAAYRRLLAEDANPDELEAGLREWGSGEARIVSAAAARRRRRRARAVRGRRACDGAARRRRRAGVAPPRVSLELRDDGGLVLGDRGVRTRRRSAGTAARASASCGSGSVACRSPTAGSTCGSRCSTATGRPLHTLDDAVRFFVFPRARRRGAVLLDGVWSMQENVAERANCAAMSSRACPDWPALMEIAPELQFRHYTVAEVQLPADAFVQLEGRLARRRRRLLRPRVARLQPRAHRPARRRGAARHALDSPMRRGPERFVEQLTLGRAAGVLRTSAAVAQPRRAVATESRMFCRPRTECASVEHVIGTPARIASRTCSALRSIRSGSPFVSTAVPVLERTLRTPLEVDARSAGGG